jgi:hypothetical protein
MVRWETLEVGRRPAPIVWDVERPGDARQRARRDATLFLPDSARSE